MKDCWVGNWQNSKYVLKMVWKNRPTSLKDMVGFFGLVWSCEFVSQNYVSIRTGDEMPTSQQSSKWCRNQQKTVQRRWKIKLGLILFLIFVVWFTVNWLWRDRWSIRITTEVLKYFSNNTRFKTFIIMKEQFMNFRR